VREKVVKDGWLYEIAQWFPRAAVYDDVNGWQNVQFYGQGEFYLEFGNYDVSVTVPHDHIVRATGALMNPAQVLTARSARGWRRRWRATPGLHRSSRTRSASPSARPAGTAPLTWRFTAENVRDFAWASSKTYVWDAMGFKYQPDRKTIELHSVYPRDAMPLWDKSARRRSPDDEDVRADGVRVPVPAGKQRARAGVRHGVPDDRLLRRASAGRRHLRQVARSLRAHLGHHPRGGAQLVPDDRRLDERKWTWMDEGMNSFLRVLRIARLRPQLAEARCAVPAKNIVTNYMRRPNQVPLMTESDDIHAQFGNNGYSKPAPDW
jgi:hypothetical protein